MRASAVFVLLLAATPIDRDLFAQDRAEPAAAPPAAANPREARLREVVDELVQLAEKHSGLTFAGRPKVRATTHKEWRELVQRELALEKPKDLFEMSVSMQGLYLAESREVVLSPLVVGPLTKPLDDDAPRHRKEAVAHQRATVLHELVHALQEEHFGLPSRLHRLDEEKDLGEIQRLKFVIEGHAVLVEELVAEQELGLEDFLARGPYGGLGADPSYLTGRRYFLHVLRTEGMQGVHQKLKSPPTYEELLEVASRPLPPAPPKRPAARDDRDG